MSISDEMLMAYADGELTPAERAQVETAMAADASVALRVERHRALRSKLGNAFSSVLSEPAPERLIAAVRAAPVPRDAATVIDMNTMREARTAEQIARARAARPSWTWAQWGAVAASLVIGAVIGHIALNSPDSSPIATRGGHLLAQAGLAQALSKQLASEQAASAAVQIGTSFRAKSGSYCRTFVVHEQRALGGLACREGDAWHVQVLAQTDSTPGGDGGYRPAGSEMPAAVRGAVEEQIAGDPLDAASEVRARNNDWR